jgi:ElaB/YqjD/DUF883 family membrane-anchored ribosome-binding protein
MKRTRKAASKAPPSIEEELAKIRHDVTSLGALLGEAASAEANARLASLRQRVDKLADEAGALTDASIEEIRGRIEEHPLASVAVAFGLGVLLARVLQR